VLERAFADPPVEHEALGTRVHVHHTELRWLWLDRAAGRAA
jgi:hypothetical protein